MRFGPAAFFFDQLSPVPPPLHADLAGRTVVVTGANAGIGLEAAKHFARMRPARLIVASRSEDKGRVAVEEIARETNYAAELHLLDLADFASVRTFAGALKDAPVDILVCNAGVTQPNFNTTKDGWEEGLQVNHLAPALLTFLLLPSLLQAATAHGCRARAVYVTSELHHHAQLPPAVRAAPGILRALNDRAVFPADAGRGGWYYETKMFNIMFARSLAAHLPQHAPLVATAANPGLCRTAHRRHLPAPLRAATAVLGALVGRSAEQGARAVLRAALGPDGHEGAHVRFLQGAYVSGAVVGEPSDFVVGREGWEVAERVWRETIEILADVAPEVREIAEANFVEET